MRNARELGREFRGRPAAQPDDLHGALGRAADDVSRIFDSPDVVLIWEEAEEPFLLIAAHTDGRFSCREVSSPSYSPLVCDDIAEASFWIDGDRLIRIDDERRAPARAIHPAVRAETGPGPLLSFPIIAASGSGRVFVRVAAPEDAAPWLLAADAAGRLVGEEIDRHLHVAAAVAAAVEGERIRLARDLHDGLLQSFTGIVLQLETAHNVLASQPDEAKRMLTEAEAALMADQRELRSYVQQLRPRGTRPEVVFDFAARLEELRARLEQQWGIRMQTDVSRVDPSISAFLGYETFRLVHEAVMNSAKHGAAKNVSVTVHTSDGRIRIDVSDDGVGFSFRGRLTLDDVRRREVGPFMLAERVAALNGDLSVESSEAGARVEISVPIGFTGVES